MYRGRELPYTVPFKNPTIFRKPYKYVPYTVLNRGILKQPYTVPYAYHGHKQKSTAVIHPEATAESTMYNGCHNDIRLSIDYTNITCSKTM